MDGGSRGTAMESTRTDVLSGMIPLLKVLCLALMGLVLAHPRVAILPRATLRLLSKLVFALFLPCLIFTHLGISMTPSNFILWWFVPVNVLIATLFGCILGYAVAVICRPPPQFFRFTVIMTGFGNTGNLPLAIVSSVCHSSDQPFGPDCHRQGVAYVSFAQWVAVILVYTLVYHMMEPPLEFYEIVAEDAAEDHHSITVDDDGPAVSVGGDISRPLLVEAEWPGIEEKETRHDKTPFIARVFNSLHSGISQLGFPDLDPNKLDGPSSMDAASDGDYSPKSVRCLAEPRVVRKFRIVVEQTPIRHVMQPPTIASLLAIVVGMIPQLKELMFGDDAPLSFFTDSLEILAGAMVPSVLLILGGMLAEGPNESKLGTRTTIGIGIARLLILPLFGIGVVALADKLNLLVAGDKMYRFVLLLQYTTPSAILLGAIASLRGYAVSESSALLFWQHVFAVFSLSIYIVLYFKLLSYV